MRDFTHPLERAKRLLCRVFGHKLYECSRGEPALPPVTICKRCGKFAPAYLPKAVKEGGT